MKSKLQSLKFKREYIVFAMFLLLSVFTSPLFAQITVSNKTTPSEIDKCGETRLFEFTVSNTSNASITGTLLLDLPTGAYYELGTIAGGPTVADVSNQNQPTFDLTVGPVSSVTVSFNAGVYYGFNLMGGFNYTFDGTSMAAPVTISQLNTPNLIISNTTNNPITANVGDVITRDITILQNSAPSNQLSSFTFQDSHTASIDVQNIEILVGGAVITGGTFDYATSSFTLDGAAIDLATGTSYRNCYRSLYSPY